jgi:transcriptional regulator with XRE-family HTH domain
LSMFPLVLQRLRLEKQITRQEMADHLGITVQAYGYYENGKREPGIKMLIKIANFFDVSLDFLVGREGHPTADQDANFFFINSNGLTEEELDIAIKHVEFLKYKAKERNNEK